MIIAVGKNKAGRRIRAGEQPVNLNSVDRPNLA